MESREQKLQRILKQLNAELKEPFVLCVQNTELFPWDDMNVMGNINDRECSVFILEMSLNKLKDSGNNMKVIE